MTNRSTAFILNGGAGRIICAIPALEIFEQTNPNDDFIVIVEHGLDLFKGHPTLYKRCFDAGHKGLFQDKVKNMNVIIPEPYHVWEYYNQQASISQAFDVVINKGGVRNLQSPTLILSNEEYFGGFETIKQISNNTKYKKTIVFQPFGRGTGAPGAQIGFDIFGKSFFIDDVVKIVSDLQEKFNVILMSETMIDFEKIGYKDIKVAQLSNMSLRRWIGIINAADYLLGCDSVGQHIAFSLNKPGTIVLGGTFASNVTYPTYEKFDIIDVGKDKKMYSPIRICYDEVADLNNEKIMRLTNEQITNITKSVIDNLNKL